MKECIKFCTKMHEISLVYNKRIGYNIGMLDVFDYYGKTKSKHS